MTNIAQTSHRRVAVGVDTHLEVHVAAVLDELGRDLGDRSFSANTKGYEELLAWAHGFGEVLGFGVEGTGSFGAGLARLLLRMGEQVIEVNRPNRQDRRRFGKSDPADARSAAKVVLNGRTAIPKAADSTVEMIRMIHTAKASAMKSRTQAWNVMKADLVTAPAELREELEPLGPAALLRRAALLRPGPIVSPMAAARHTLRALARRITELDEEIAAHVATLVTLTAKASPRLVDTFGIGPDSAAVLLVAAGDNPQRMCSEAAFSMLCGASPKDASSGKQQRHRLNRGGDRRANAALHRIVLTRMRWHEPTRAYVERRTTEGKTKREIMRCLKRFVAGRCTTSSWLKQNPRPQRLRDVTWRSVARPAGGALGIVLAATLATALLLGPMSPADAAEVARPPAPNAACQSEYSTGLDIHRSIDADGNQLTMTDPSGNVTTSTYDADGRLCWSEPLPVTSPSCSSPPTGSGTYTTTDYYDADGNTIAVTGQNGDPAACDPVTTSGCSDTTYNVYDEQDRELNTTDPSGNETQYTYDANGNLKQTTAPSSSTGTDTYNGDGELIEVAYSDGTPTVSYQYGTNDEVCWMFQGGVSTNACGSPPTPTGTEVTTTYGYNSAVELTSETTTTPSSTTTVTYGYDASGDVACVSYPNSAGNTCASPGSGVGIVDYTYGQPGQLSSLTDWAGDTLTFAYNGSGQECWVSTYAPTTPSCSSPPYQSGNVTEAYAYDGNGNVSDVKTTTGSGPTNLLDLDVGSNRNADYFITEETPTVGGTAMATDDYSYNSTNQISSGPITGSGSDSYVYTAAGSITQDTKGFASAAYTSSGELCWTYSSTSSNACGSPPSGSTTYSYDSDGQRTAMTPSSGNSASYGWETESGLLTCANTNGTSCSTSSPTNTTSVYTYDGNGLRTSDTVGSSSPTQFTWGTGEDTPELLSDGTWDYVYIPGSVAPLEQVAATGSSPAVDLLLQDESGNTRGLVQLSSGTHQDQLVNYTDYAAYGYPITQSGGSAETGGLTVAQTGINSNYVGTTPWGFGEGYTDASTGLIYLVHRYYDPATAQFMSVDPDLSQTNQAYPFAADNPINASDPLGEYVGKPTPTSTLKCVTDKAWTAGVNWGGPYLYLWANPCLAHHIFDIISTAGDLSQEIPLGKYQDLIILALKGGGLAFWFNAAACGLGDIDVVVHVSWLGVPTAGFYPPCWPGGYVPDDANMSGAGWTHF